MLKTDVVLLVLRLIFGGTLLFAHGLPKLLAFSEKAETFADPIGVGSSVSLALAVFAEVFCAAGVAFGVMTRWAAIPCAFTMAVAGLVVHAADPWGKKELPLLYLTVFVCLIIAGGGRFALDSLRPKAAA